MVLYSVVFWENWRCKKKQQKLELFKIEDGHALQQNTGKQQKKKCTNICPGDQPLSDPPNLGQHPPLSLLSIGVVCLKSPLQSHHLSLFLSMVKFKGPLQTHRVVALGVGGLRSTASWDYKRSRHRHLQAYMPLRQSHRTDIQQESPVRVTRTHIKVSNESRREEFKQHAFHSDAWKKKHLGRYKVLTAAHSSRCTCILPLCSLQSKWWTPHNIRLIFDF